MMLERMPQKLVDFGVGGAIVALPDNAPKKMIKAARFYVSAEVLWDAVGVGENGTPFALREGEPDMNYFGGLWRENIRPERIK
jgi:hypothetical protein